jgi:hypothetical protein
MIIKNKDFPIYNIEVKDKETFYEIEVRIRIDLINNSIFFEYAKNINEKNLPLIIMQNVLLNDIFDLTLKNIEKDPFYYKLYFISPKKFTIDELNEIFKKSKNNSQIIERYPELFI